MSQDLPKLPQSIQDKSPYYDFRRSLSPQDRQLLDGLFESASRHIPAVDHSGHPLPYQVYLLSLLIEEHREIARLRRELDDLLGRPPSYLLSDSV
jgi:hypothetical protein